MLFWSFFVYLREYPVGIGIDIEKLHLKSAKNDWSSLSNFCLFSFFSHFLHIFPVSLQYLWAVLSLGPFGQKLYDREMPMHIYICICYINSFH